MTGTTLHHPRYARSNGYDPEWVARNQMGPNALWLTEALTEVMTIEPGMKVLDLGCGRAMSSEWDFCCFHTPGWWRTHWLKTGKVSVDHADLVPDGWRDWLQFNDFIAPRVEGWWIDEVAKTHDMLTVDQGTEIGFARVVATRHCRAASPPAGGAGSPRIGLGLFRKPRRGRHGTAGWEGGHRHRRRAGARA